MKAELDRVAYLLEEASKSLSAGQADEAGNHLFEARGILDQALEAVAPAPAMPVVNTSNRRVATVKRKTPAA